MFVNCRGAHPPSPRSLNAKRPFDCMSPKAAIPRRRKRAATTHPLIALLRATLGHPRSPKASAKQNARLVRILHEVLLECDASWRRRSAMARRRLRIALSACPSKAKHPTPNFLYWAIGDERCKFLQWAEWRADLGELLLRCHLGRTRARKCFPTWGFLF